MPTIEPERYLSLPKNYQESRDSNAASSSKSPTRANAYSGDFVRASPPAVGKFVPFKNNSEFPKLKRPEMLKASTNSYAGSPIHNSLAVQDKLKELIEKNKNSLTKKRFSLLTKKNLVVSNPIVSSLHHERSSTSTPFFFSIYATEKPALSLVHELHPNEQAYYRNRHIGKRGRHLESDLPIEGGDSKVGQLKTSPPMLDQSIEIRNIRAHASDATISRSTRGLADLSLHQHVVEAVKTTGDPHPIVHVVRPSRDLYAEDATLNFFTYALQQKVGQDLHDIEAGEQSKIRRLSPNKQRPAITFTTNKSLIGLSRTSRTEASPIGRLVQQPFFSTHEILPGEKVVLADDHVQAGGSMLAMESALKTAGVDVLGMITLSTHPASAKLQISPEAHEILHETLSQWDPEKKIEKKLASLGIPIENLTSSEALIITAYAMDPENEPQIKKFRGIQQKFFEKAYIHNLGLDPNKAEGDLNRELHNLRQRQNAFGTETAKAFLANAHVLEGEHDSLEPILAQSPKSPDAVLEELDHVGREERKIVQGADHGAVYVMDWDDCISDEKDLNRQLMLKALADSAGGADIDLALERLQKIMTPKSSPNDAPDKKPYLAMQSEELSHLLIQNPHIFKRHVIANLIDTLLPEVSDQQRQKTTNLILKNFIRQYKALDPERTKDQPSSPTIEHRLKPGMQEFLDEKRTPGNRIILNSNKGDNDLNNEVNRLGLSWYFDHIQGVACVSSPKTTDTLPEMSENLQTRIMSALKGADAPELRRTLEEAVPYAHPDVTKIDKYSETKGQRLVRALADLSVSPETPIISIGDQPHDAQQLDAVAGHYQNLTGLVLNPGLHPEVLAAQEASKFPIHHLETITELKTHPAFQTSPFS